MQRNVILMALIAGSLFAQTEPGKTWFFSAGGVSQSISAAGPVQGSPYSATVVNESIQTLADGNRIVERSSGTTARDSQGRTRSDAALPTIGNMSAAAAPHLAFIVDPVAEVSYTLNLDEKTAHAMSGTAMAGPGKVVIAGVPPPPVAAMAAGAIVTSGVVTSATTGGMPSRRTWRKSKLKPRTKIWDPK
jgi:hypothetical protein